MKEDFTYVCDVNFNVIISNVNKNIKTTVKKYTRLRDGVAEQRAMGLLNTREYCRQTLALGDALECELTKWVGVDKAREIVGCEF